MRQAGKRTPGTKAELMSKRNSIILANVAGATLAAYFSGLTELVSFDALKARLGELLVAVEARPR